MVYRGLDTVHFAHQDELAGAKLPSFCLLVLRRAEHHDFGSKLRRELNGEVTKSTNTHDTHSIRAANRRDKRTVDRRAGTLQRRGRLRAQRLGDAVDVCLTADIVVAEGAVVVVGLAEDDAVVAIDVAARQAVPAVAARGAVEASAGAVADFQRRYGGADRDYFADAFVA